jgi:lysophospholipid acyltransferase (LPLAT)-like uncharacterized protein
MFKRLANSAAIPYVGGTLIWAYQSIVAHTVRWRVEGVDHLRRLWAGDHGWVLATWHSRILLMSVPKIIYGPKWGNKLRPPALMVSNSRDGEFTNRTAHLLGLAVIRGSAANKAKTKDKRGVLAAREAITYMRNGGGVVVTIDGPKGPPEVVGLGAIKLAQQVGADILVYGLSAQGKRLNTWDRLLLPRPFGRGAMVIGDPIPASKDMDSEELRARVEVALKQAMARADELAGLPSLPETRAAYRQTVDQKPEGPPGAMVDESAATPALSAKPDTAMESHGS